MQGRDKEKELIIKLRKEFSQNFFVKTIFGELK
jgi:hypothetical protein